MAFKSTLTYERGDLECLWSLHRFGFAIYELSVIDISTYQGPLEMTFYRLHVTRPNFSCPKAIHAVCGGDTQCVASAANDWFRLWVSFRDFHSQPSE
jgi:hypothetical protein